MKSNPCKIQLAISTCPNDTFAFHALMHRLVSWRGLDFEVRLLDIQELNEGLFRGEFDVAKTSFHAALLLADQTVVLPSGSALGFGVGPLLLSASADNTKPPSCERSAADKQVVLCPGEQTTATLLFKIFHGGTAEIQHGVFSDIMPKLLRGEADYGVCIHEGRFTWQQQGLGLVEDLGVLWEAKTHAPLPLGGMVARRTLPFDVLSRIQQVIQSSIEYARQTPESALPTMREYAQEFDDCVLMQHVDLYVNDWTIDLGAEGRLALDELSRRAAQAGVIASRKIEVFKPA
ncbi:1,4-dihydroxy-6-naphtoate synthase [Novipirellula aureliae]|uniref:1,4-dihydroxy-6-naphtoate synthase n=1 Tax=Novipirellula aureliae TaxID=2527966 RepID=A0A5C6E9V6_9BACT|nr:1,4-dihydroxy-6-naphthoate synthase [Novipirellula aureliae]TWU45628.1 1,4-dihydroxy-6-naphtoate synthase [Novipirellula aureliae]